MIKWIGQHIWDFISRFRNDVYLENIADGTVVDNKFLGLDSNNKIVKEAASTTVTDLHSAGVDGSANQLLTDNGDGTITSEANATFGNDSLQLSSSVSGKPTLDLINSNTDAVAPELAFWKTATGADRDNLGKITFRGDDAGGNADIFAQIIGEIAEADHGSEEGKLTLSVASHDAELQPGLIIASGDAEDEVDVTIGNTTTSNTTTAGSLIVNGSSVAINSTSSAGGKLALYEGTDNGTNILRINAPAAITTDTDLVLPDGVGSSGQVLTTDGNNPAALSWTSAGGWHGSTTRIKILASDFIPDDGGRPAFIDDTGSGSENFFLESFSSNVLYATVAIPTGFTATHVMIYGSATDAIEVWEMQINSKTGVSKGTGNVDTEIDITDVALSLIHI